MNKKINIDDKKIKDEIQEKEKERKENSLKLMDILKKTKIEFKKESDEKNQLYGSVSKKEIQLFLEEKDIKLLSDDIKILEPIRSLGEHLIEVNPYEGITEKIKVIVKKN